MSIQWNTFYDLGCWYNKSFVEAYLLEIPAQVSDMADGPRYNIGPIVSNSEKLVLLYVQY